MFSRLFLHVAQTVLLINGEVYFVSKTQVTCPVIKIFFVFIFSVNAGYFNTIYVVLKRVRSYGNYQVLKCEQLCTGGADNEMISFRYVSVFFVSVVSIPIEFQE